MNTETIKKDFEGQYSGEKILLRTNPHPVFFFFQNFLVIFGVFVFLGIFLLFTFFLKLSFWIFGAVAFLGIFLQGFWYFRLFRQSKYTITTRRCIRFVPKNIYKKSYNEIHLVDLRTAVPKTNFFGRIFGYGMLILTDKDDKKIVYEGIAEQKFIARYLSRVIDYIKIHGHTDNISTYQKRKDRIKHK